MSNYLKIYDFHIEHKQRNIGKNVDYARLAVDKEELRTLINSDITQIESIQRQLIFDSFANKISTDLNLEVLKNESTQKLIKKSIYKNGQGLLVPRNLSKDRQNNIYGILHAGKITKDSVLEKVNSNNDEGNEYDSLNGDRIYDDFLFLLHISFRCNIARLFILTPKNTTIIDSILKKYLSKDLFNAPSFKKVQPSDFVPAEYRREVLNRSFIKNIYISKSDTILSESDGIEYEVEIKLKPKTRNPISTITDSVLSKLKKSAVTIDDSTSDDEHSHVKVTLKDDQTNKSKTIAYSNTNNFTPSIVVEREDVSTSDKFDVEKFKEICMEYISYNENGLL